MISIITPVYNGERFIKSCIKVVIDQACPDVEHIIVDGDSKDRTVDIIQRYAAKYPHIRWISEKDNGQSDAMNKGIAMAKGEILGILNADDFYEPNVLNRILELFKTLPEPSLLVGNCNLRDDEGNVLQVNKPSKLRFKELLLGHYVNPLPANPSAYFYHTSLHSILGPYKVDEHYAMDLDFILRAVQVATVKYVDETWGNFCLIKGTKTLDDIVNGQGPKRIERLIEDYRNKLSRIQRWQIAIARESNSCKRGVKHYLRRIMQKRRIHRFV
jgi:glycosyltransferase involved in cell wall biosynthesis